MPPMLGPVARRAVQDHLGARRYRRARYERTGGMETRELRVLRRGRRGAALRPGRASGSGSPSRRCPGRSAQLERRLGAAAARPRPPAPWRSPRPARSSCARAGRRSTRSTPPSAAPGGPPARAAVLGAGREGRRVQRAARQAARRVRRRARRGRVDVMLVRTGRAGAAAARRPGRRGAAAPAVRRTDGFDTEELAERGPGRCSCRPGTPSPAAPSCATADLAGLPLPRWPRPDGGFSRARARRSTTAPSCSS